LTIGRVRSGKNKGALKEKMACCKLETADYQKTSSIILFQSKLTPHGPVYTKLHESSFHPGVETAPRGGKNARGGMRAA
jgi:2'-5' RNA ligase